jgi:chromosome segregation ATPase
MTEFMGKRVNLFLVLMLMLVLIGFGGVSVYYQYTFKNLNQKYDNVSNNLGVCEQNLSQTTNAFMTAVKNLNSTETDIRKYDTLYEQKAGELEGKKTDLANTQAELTRVTVQKEVYKAQIDQAYTQIINLNRTITNLYGQINGLTAQVSRLNSRVSCLRKTADANEPTQCD